QSAVSRQVAVTERAVGTPLFERHARGTRPTPAGEALARHAGRVLDEIAPGDGLPEYDLEGLRLTALRGARGAGVAVAESHPFAVRERIEPDELADQGW